MAGKRLIAVALLFVSLAGFNQNLRADTLDTVIDIVLQAIDPSLAQSRPLIKCLAQGGSVSVCAQQYAEQEANSAVSDMMASDPKITLVVNLIKAANSGDWLTVLELTGTDLLAQIACSAGMPGGGPIKSFVCSGLFGQVASLAKPVVRQILVAIRDRDWMKLVALAGPQLACDVIPGDDPVSGAVCSVLGKLIGGVGGAIAGGAGAVWGQIESWSEDLQGQGQHMPYDEYYAKFLQHLTHKRALQRIMSNRQGLGMDSGEWNTCVDYFDSHRQARDTAEKTCNDLGRRLHNESVILADYAETVPQTFFDANLKPALRDLVAERYRGDAVEQYRSFIFSLQPHQWGLGQQPSTQNPFFDQYKGNFKNIALMLYGSNSFWAFPGLVPDSLRDWAIYHSAGRIYAEALVLEKLRLNISVKPKLESAGCSVVPPAGDSGSLVFKCANINAYQSCKEEFDGYRYSHCRIDPVAAASSAGHNLVQILGSKRCSFLEESKEGYWDPRVVCTRPWKKDQCDQLLAQQTQGIATPLKCKYALTSQFKQQSELAQQILAALNAPEPAAEETQTSGDTPRLQLSNRANQLRMIKPSMKKRPQILPPDNCRATWDPLALHCTKPEVLYTLSQRLPGASLPICQQDPNKDGADAPCYSGPYPIDPALGRKKTIDLPGKQQIALPGGGSSTSGSSETSSRNGLRSPGPSTGFAPSTGTALTPEEPQLTISLPDQALGRGLSVANLSTRWGNTLTVNANTLEPRSGGCLVPIIYRIENLGAVISPAASEIRWTVAGHPPSITRPIGRIRACAGLRQEIELVLYPGDNNVDVLLDHQNRIRELSETNNNARISVHLRGNCTPPSQRFQRVDPGQPSSGSRLRFSPR